jgi:hypothetical protein
VPVSKTRPKVTKKTSQRKSGNPAAAKPASAPEHPTAEGSPVRRELLSRPFNLGALLAAIFVATAALMLVEGVAVAGSQAAVWTAMVLPALVTAVCVTDAWRHGWHRWLVVLAITYTAIPVAAPLLYLFGTAWCLYRFWWVEHDQNLITTAWRRTVSRRRRPMRRTSD